MKLNWRKLLRTLCCVCAGSCVHSFTAIHLFHSQKPFDFYGRSLCAPAKTITLVLWTGLQCFLCDRISINSNAQPARKDAAMHADAPYWLQHCVQFFAIFGFGSISCCARSTPLIRSAIAVLLGVARSSEQFTRDFM